MKIKKRFQVVTIEESLLNEDKAYIEKFIMENPQDIIYIVRNGILLGIVTLGNLMRNSFQNMPLVDRNFTFLTEEQKDKAEEIFLKKKNINRIPVLDGSGRILYELYRDLGSSKKKFFEKRFYDLNYGSEDLDELIGILELYGISQIVFVNDDNGCYEVSELIKENFSKKAFEITEAGCYEVLELCRKSWEGCSHILIIDLGIDSFLYRSQIYMKHKIQVIGYSDLLNIIIFPMFGDCKNNYVNSVEMLINSFDMLGIIGDSLAARKFMELCPEKCFLIDDPQLSYSPLTQQFTIVNCDKIPEAFISCNFLVKDPIVKINEKEIVNVSFGSLYLALQGISDYDLAYNIIPKLKNRGIQTLCISFPDHSIDKLKDKQCLEALEKRSSEADCSIKNQEKNMARKDYQDIIGYEQEETKFLVKELLNQQVTNEKGYPDRANFKGAYFNVYDGERYTEGSIENRIYNSINLFGPCTILGTMVKDEDTIASHLQKIVDGSYCVRNFGNHFSWNNYKIRNCARELGGGDIVVAMVNNNNIFLEKDIPVFDIMGAYNKIPQLQNCVWEILGHCNYKLSSLIAEEIFELLKENGLLNHKGREKARIHDANKYNDIKNYNGAIESWLNSVKPYIKPDYKKVGCIVMNCNPFTLGHKYLVETAAKEVEYLYLFVVEENKSFFSFEDRFNMVKRGVQEFKNVCVLPSGNFMISAMTLPGYFKKDYLQEVVIDATEDLTIFATKIAPTFHITVRFAGEEPNDKFTKQYNKAMEMELPKYQIQFIEIPRKQVEHIPISATNVRNFLKQQDFDKIKKLVPETTYDYLYERYKMV